MKKLFLLIFIFFSLTLFSVTLGVQNTTGTCGQQNVPVYISIDDATGLAAFQFDLYFDNTKIQFVSASNTSLTSNFLVESNNLGNYVRIAAATGSPLSSGSGEICALYFNVVAESDGSSYLDLENSLVNDLPPAEVDGTFTISGCCAIPSGMPNNSAQDLDPCSLTGIQINWQEPSNWGDRGNGTRYFQVLRDGIDVSGNLSSSIKSYIDNKTSPGINYHYQVKAINGCGESYSTSGITIMDNSYSIPTCSTNPNPTDGSNSVPTSVLLSWTSSEATSYDLYFGKNPNPSYLATTTNNFYELKNLEPFTDYYWKVVPNNPCGSATSCPVWRFKTGEEQIEYAEFFLVPAGAHSEGGYGSFWKTDLSICNLSDSKQNLEISLLKAGEDNLNPESFEVVLEKNKCTGFDDIFYEKFSYEGAGALKISSTTSEVLIESRTYDDDAEGTYGQYIPSFNKNNLLKKNEIGYISFLKRNENFRTNIGFSSLSENLIEIKIELFSSEGEKLDEKIVNLLPLSYIQINDIFSQLGSNNISYGYAILSSSSENAYYTTYASIVDNKSNDPIFIPVKKL